MTKEMIPFEACVIDQILLLNSGLPMQAFDKYFAGDGLMYANGTLFASGDATARAKQAPFIDAAIQINGKITDLFVDTDNKLCVFRNKTSFHTAADKVNQIDGLCWQRWHDDQVIKERYFDGTMMQSLISAGVLQNPSLLLNINPTKPHMH